MAQVVAQTLRSAWPGSTMAPGHQHVPVAGQTLGIYRAISGKWSHGHHPRSQALQDLDMALGSGMCPEVSLAPYGSPGHPISMALGAARSSDTDMVRGGRPDSGPPHGPQ